MARMTVSFFISAALVWFWFRWLPRRDGLGPLPDAFSALLTSWLCVGCVSWCLRFFFGGRPAPEDISFLGWYREGMSYLATTGLVFLSLGGFAWHTVRRKFKIPPRNLSEKIDDFFDPPLP